MSPARDDHPYAGQDSHASTTVHSDNTHSDHSMTERRHLPPAYATVQRPEDRRVVDRQVEMVERVHDLGRSASSGRTSRRGLLVDDARA